ncbi:hypothetical protein [Methanoculleus sp.]
MTGICAKSAGTTARAMQTGGGPGRRRPEDRGNGLSSMQEIPGMTRFKPG